MPTITTTPREIADLDAAEIASLLEDLYDRYGFDFRNYAPSSLKRRIARLLDQEQAESLGELRQRLRDPACMERFLQVATIHVTSMFRDPSFYVAFRAKVVPALRTYPFVRIWDAGCATGEEVYSLAIVLQEEGLASRCRIYATDMSEVVLRTAAAGVFPMAAMQDYTANYQLAGGLQPFSSYYTAKYDRAVFKDDLKKNIVFAQHNLVTDGSFNDFHVILCRNVLIYFNDALAARVHDLMYNSLCILGYLGLGSKESIRFSPRETCYEEIDARERIYRRIR